jgi:membrane-associated phospholipid phosphatase
MKLHAALVLMVILASPAPMCAKDAIERTGDLLQLAMPGAAVVAIAVHHDGGGLLQFAESVALNQGVTDGLKYAINERRPNGGHYSFPSGHTSIAFCSAEFLRKRYGWEYGIPAYVAAAFTGYSRVESREHWTHDVVAGAAIGFGSSYLFTRSYKGWSVQPAAGSSWRGLITCRRW